MRYGPMGPSSGWLSQLGRHASCCYAAGVMLAAAGADFGSSLFKLLGADFLARFMQTTGEAALLLLLLLLLLMMMMMMW